MIAPSLLSALPIYPTVASRAQALASFPIEKALETDSQRAADFTVAAAGLELDYSRHLIDRETLALLLTLADEARLPERIQAFMRGDPVNTTERRPALHTLLRSPNVHEATLEPMLAQVSATRERMQGIANQINAGEHLGFKGRAITDVVNIGIGGSDLGPRLVSGALRPFSGAVRCHYVANVDPADLQNTLAELDAATTLFIICSKSFRTEETLANSLAAREWLRGAGADERDIYRHFFAVTTNLDAAHDFGIPERNCLPLWDWVGGRYSVWSAIGLSCAIAVGWDNFSQFLAGAHAMDEHFRSAETADNMPVLAALLEVWYTSFHHAGSHVVLPYDHALRSLPDFLQQLTMESNGKQVSSAGAALDYDTAPVLWGCAGTLGQHSFHQMLHQGTRLCPVDFVLPLSTHTGAPQQHARLVANCLAQSRALMVGRPLESARESLLQRGLSEESAAELAPHLVMPGNRPSSIISMPALNPETLGALLALYEHRTFCSAQLWGINAFDQWGVELGKEIGEDILNRMQGDANAAGLDAATQRHLSAWRDQAG